MRESHLLLITSRAAITTFFGSLSSRVSGPFAISQLPLTADALVGRPPTTASIAVVDAALDPPVAIGLCRELHGRQPELPIVGLLCRSRAITPWQLRTLLAVGVGSLMDLHTPASETLHLLQDIVQGDMVLAVRLRGDQAPRRGGDGETYPRSVPTAQLLTQANTDLLVLIAQGLSDVEIGQRLHLSPHTVKHLIERLRDEVGARNRIALAAWAGHQGFLRPGPTSEPETDQITSVGYQPPELHRERRN